MTRGLARVALLLTLAGAIAARANAQVPTAPQVDADAIDRFTFAVPAEARVTHVSLDLRVDFTEKRLLGTARLRAQLAKGATRIVLDTKGLEIDSVVSATNQPLPFVLGDGDALRGRPLILSLAEPARSAATLAVLITYRTAPGAAALQWLDPAQTAGGTAPFLFTQGQAILTRSWIPTQDSPGLRQTYDARIVVPNGARAVMSAEGLTPEGEPVEGGGRAFRFRMTQSIPPYLMALAVGDLAFRSLGDRTGVYAEPSRLEAAAAELSELERMLSSAERQLGPYRWRRYDVLVLPPAFPFGGMENPRLTFASPTIIAGDKSLTSVIVHEIAHSWAGNLVTNATWRDAWLNEGLTTYLELRLVEMLYGSERARMLEAVGRAELLADIQRLGVRAASTQLHRADIDDDPDGVLDGVAYNKGSAFFRMLEQELGRARLDAYLSGYIQRWAFKSLTTPAFLADLRQYLLAADPALEARLQVDTWLFQPGLPANATTPVSETLTAIDRAAADYAAHGDVSALPATWSAHEWVRFLMQVPSPLPLELLQRLDERFQLTRHRNSEVLFAWVKLGLASHYDPALNAADAFLSSMGRRRFVEPLFATMMRDAWGQPHARRLYARVRPTYHPVVVASVDALMGR